jgi:hypothetical protein
MISIVSEANQRLKKLGKFELCGENEFDVERDIRANVKKEIEDIKKFIVSEQKIRSDNVHIHRGTTAELDCSLC